MLQPVNLLMAHFNVEHSAQISKDAIAAAQQTGQGKEVVEESVKRTQIVQAGLAAAEPRKVKRREEEEEREHRRDRQEQSFSDQADFAGENAEPKQAETKEITVKKTPKSFDLYA